jgi:Protein of unknown function (DUF1440)
MPSVSASRIDRSRTLTRQLGRRPRQLVITQIEFRHFQAWAKLLIQRFIVAESASWAASCKLETPNTSTVSILPVSNSSRLLKEPPMFHTENETEPCTLSGFAAGCAGGLIATLVMHMAETLTVHVADNIETRQAQTPEGAKTVAANQGFGAGPQENAAEGTIATKRTVTALSRNLFGHEITSDERAVVAGIIPLAFGTLVGGLYGVLAERFDVVALGKGTAYGAAVWLGAEELALPGLKFTKPVTEKSWSSHATGLAGHLIYGFTLNAARRAIRPFLR